jgi:hypothetical protein
MPRINPITLQQAEVADRMIALRRSTGWSKRRFAQTLRMSIELLTACEAKRMPWTLKRLRDIPWRIDDEIKGLQAAFKDMREALADIDPPDREETRLWILNFLEACHPYADAEDRLFADLNEGKPQLLRMEVLRPLLKDLEGKGHIEEWKPQDCSEAADDVQKQILAAVNLVCMPRFHGRTFWKITDAGKVELKALKIKAGWRNVK